SMAAAFTLSGVSKSGSPEPSEMMSRPCRWSSRARLLTARVADGLTRDRAADCRLDMGVLGAGEGEACLRARLTVRKWSCLRGEGAMVGRILAAAGLMVALVVAAGPT